MRRCSVWREYKKAGHFWVSTAHKSHLFFFKKRGSQLTDKL
jgi:hypothetical protein